MGHLYIDTMTKISAEELYDDRSVIKQVSKLTKQADLATEASNTAVTSASKSASEAKEAKTAIKLLIEGNPAGETQAEKDGYAKTLADAGTFVNNFSDRMDTAEGNINTLTKAVATNKTNITNNINEIDSIKDTVEKNFDNSLHLKGKSEQYVDGHIHMQGGDIYGNNVQLSGAISAVGSSVTNETVGGTLTVNTIKDVDIAVTGTATVPDTAVTDTSRTAVNSKRLSEASNWFVNRTSNQEVNGNKVFNAFWGGKNLVGDFVSIPSEPFSVSTVISGYNLQNVGQTVGGKSDEIQSCMQTRNVITPQNQRLVGFSLTQFTKDNINKVYQLAVICNDSKTNNCFLQFWTGAQWITLANWTDLDYYTGE